MTSEQQPPEAVVARLRPHARVLVLPTIVLIGVLGLTGYFAGRFDELWMNLLVVVSAVLLILLVWLAPLLAWLGRNYTITTRRVVLRHGFLVRVRQELLHSRGYDVTVRKNAVQSLFGSGDVEINSGLEHPVVLRDIPDADLVQAALHDLMERSLNPVAGRRAAEQASPDETTMWGRR
jgi:membrane protein YdbS with pleckstrin-like domain